MPSPDFYAVDRLEGGGRTAVLVADDGAVFHVARTKLPEGTREGTVLRVRLGSNGRPDWSSAELDEAERERRLRASRERLDRLAETDRGGDLTL